MSYIIAGNKMSGDIPTELGNLDLLKNLDIRKFLYVMLRLSFDPCLKCRCKSRVNMIKCIVV